MENSQHLSTRRKLYYILDRKVPGIKRKRYGKGFRYFDQHGRLITFQNILNRIDNLHIPPAWNSVWICPDKYGHIQATGVDEKGRKQYLYHQLWQEISSQNKFNKMLVFAAVLPKIRRRVSNDIYQRDLSREKVLATLVWILEHTFIRIGNKEYVKKNNSFGLTTLKTKHVTLLQKEVRFHFRGKKGIKHLIGITHPRVLRTLKKCIELPGYELFQYVDTEGKKHAIDSAAVNEYLKEITGKNVTAKDFRTWGGTVMAAKFLNQIGNCSSKRDCRKKITAAVKEVSYYLGNTPVISRNYYIHPAVLKVYEEGNLNDYFQTINSKENRRLGLRKPEHAVVAIIRKSV